MSTLTHHLNFRDARDSTMASRATQDPVENLLRDIEGQMEALRQNIQDGAAVYVSRQRPVFTCFVHMY